MRAMRRSRAAVATIEAAAMVALVPFSADDRLVRGRSSAERKVTVDESKLRPLAQGAKRPLEAGQVCGAKSDPVDLARGNGDERDRFRWVRTAWASRSRLAGARRFES